MIFRLSSISPIIHMNRCNTGGNNNILSLILVKYSKEQLKCIMLLIYKIISKAKTHFFESCHLDSFNIDEDNHNYTFDNYLLYKINSINEDDDDYFFVLKALFIISLVYDIRVRLFIFGDYTKRTRFATKLNPKIDITLFLKTCEQIITDFKENHISLTDIAYYSTIEWVHIGLYVL